MENLSTWFGNLIFNYVESQTNLIIYNLTHVDTPAFGLLILLIFIRAYRKLSGLDNKI